MTGCTDLADVKRQARRAAFERRARAKATDDGTSGTSVRDHLLAAGMHTGAEVVSGYCPIRTEIDVFPLMTALWSAGHRLCVPVIEAAKAPLLFREWTPDAEMMDGSFGARIPAEGAWLEPHLLLVPLLAFDRAGYRLGYGGGFYDRTLERLRALRRTLAVGVAYAAQEFDAVPREATDQPLDAIATEQGVIRIARGSD